MTVVAEVTVVPRSKKFLISVKEEKIKIYLKSAPEQNKANLELIKELSKALDGAEVRILSGYKSKRKRIEIGISKEEWKRFQSSS